MAYYSRDRIIEDRTEQIIERYKNAGWQKPKPPKSTVKVNAKDILLKDTPMDTIFQAVTALAQKVAGLVTFFSKTNTPVKEYTAPTIQDEAVKVKVKKPIPKVDTTTDSFITNEKNTDVVRDWDNMYATRQQESLHGKPKSKSTIDPREGRIGWIQAYNATHANDFDSDPLIPKRKSFNALTFKLKDRNGTIPNSTEIFFLGYSRVDGCGVYRYYGRDIEAIKQHYNIEELYE
jgi:hypothetical protein